MLPAALIVLSYLIGSVPFSFLIVKAVAGMDVRSFGSRNVGATNVARAAGKWPGIAALLLDIAKGFGAVWLAGWIVQQSGWPFAAGPHPWQSRAMWVALAGVVAVLGHMYPAWLRFHGGKGVATAAGVFLALDPVVIAGAVLVFAIVVLLFRYVSLASMVTAAAMPLLFRYLASSAPFWYVVASIAVALIVIARHHSNIARLARGTERRLGERKEEE